MLLHICVDYPASLCLVRLHGGLGLKSFINIGNLCHNYYLLFRNIILFRDSWSFINDYLWVFIVLIFTSNNTTHVSRIHVKINVHKWKFFVIADLTIYKDFYFFCLLLFIHRLEGIPKLTHTAEVLRHEILIIDSTYEREKCQCFIVLYHQYGEQI